MSGGQTATEVLRLGRGLVVLAGVDVDFLAVHNGVGRIDDDLVIGLDPVGHLQFRAQVATDNDLGVWCRRIAPGR